MPQHKMNNMEKIAFDKERIKSRLLKNAADLWGYKESEMESFDPLVKLLIEAFAGEVEKISHEINETQLRIIERLTGLISPELDVVTPAYAVMQARAVDPGTTVNRESQFIIKKGEERGKSPGSKESTEAVFSPAGEYPVYNGTILCIIAQGNAFTFENAIKKIPLIENDAVIPEDYNSLLTGTMNPKKRHSAIICPIPNGIFITTGNYLPVQV